MHRSALYRLAMQLGRHWLMIVNLAVGLYAGLPWLAPVLMHHGRRSLGAAIYTLYVSQCHQLPQRSFSLLALFGPKLTYSLAEIQSVWWPTTDPAVLRQFVGNGVMGWKVAWSAPHIRSADGASGGRWRHARPERSSRRDRHRFS